jgi:hypothetical protein
MQQGQEIDLTATLLLIAAILLTAIILYLATRIVTGRKETDSSYLLKLLASAILIWALIIVVGALISAIGDLSTVTGIQQATTVIIFTGSIYIIKILIMPTATGSYDVWERSIWIALLAFIFIYAVNYISGSLGSPLIEFFK